MRCPRATQAILLAAACAACGRLGFESESSDSEGDRPVDADPDGTDGTDATASVARCEAVRIESLKLVAQATVRGLAATATTGAFALAFLRGDHTAVDGITISPDLAPAAAAPQRTTPVLGADSDYQAVSMSWDGVRIIGATTTATGQFSLKLFPPDMALFTYAEALSNARPASPLVAASDARRYTIAAEPTAVVAYELDGDGQYAGTTALKRTTTAPPRTVAAGGARTEGFAISDNTDGSCDLVTFPDALGDGRVVSVPGGCRGVHLAQAGTDVRVVSRTGDRISVRAGSTLTRPPSLDPAVALPDSATYPAADLGLAANPRAVFSAGRPRYVWLSPDGFRIASETGDAIVRALPVGLPPGRPDAWDVAVLGADARVFAAYGTELWTFTLCD